MIIHQPEVLKKDDHTIVWSKIEMDRRPNDFPEYLWYRVPDQDGCNLSMQSDAFLVPGLLAGMHFGEDIEVRGVVSPKLAYQLEEYQHVLHFRLSEYVQQVAIQYHKLQTIPQSPSGVGTTFSGGVDSLFTLWEHLPGNESIPDFQITHGLFILGFDIRFPDRDKYDLVFRKYQTGFEQIGVQLISLETNIVQLIIPRLYYPHFYGPVLAGCAHILGGLFKRFFIPSSRDYHQLEKWTSSSDPLSDPLLSSDQLCIIHHGATHRRVDKTAVIANWKFAQENLRVCFNKDYDESGLNCSRCEKCTRTMLPLYALGTLERFRTFKKPFRSNRDGLWVARKFNPTQGYVPESLMFVSKHKSDFLPWLLAAVVLGYVRYWILKLIPKPVRKRLTDLDFLLTIYKPNTLLKTNLFSV
jgi:hypothetical protein